MGQNAIRIVVIHNPVSGRRRGARLDRVLTRMREAGVQVTLRETAGPGDAEILAREAGNFDVVAVAGGDGTVNEVLNGLGALEGGAPRGKTPALAFIPLGTANILAHELGLPRGAAALAEVILNGERRVAWPGRANGRRFLLMVSAGFDARVVARVDTVSKRFLGAGAYVVAAFKEMWRGGARCHVTVDGKDGETHEAATVIIAKARHYGGGFVLVPQARLEEPKLHVVCLAGSGAWNTLRYGLALLRGRLGELSDVRILTGDAVRVEGDSGEPVQMDGDLAGELPLEVSVDETPVTLLVPVG